MKNRLLISSVEAAYVVYMLNYYKRQRTLKRVIVVKTVIGATQWVTATNPQAKCVRMVRK